MGRKQSRTTNFPGDQLFLIIIIIISIYRLISIACSLIFWVFHANHDSLLLPRLHATKECIDHDHHHACVMSSDHDNMMSSS